MDFTASRNDGRHLAVASWGVPWPGDDEAQTDADTAWAVAQGLVDEESFADERGTAASRGGGILARSGWGEDLALGRSFGSGFPFPSGIDSTPDALLDELEQQVRARHRATAAEYRLIGRLVRSAVADPVPWVGPDPTLDVERSDARGRTVAAVRRDRRDMAERAVVAEIATRLRLSEQTVRARAAQAEVLQTRCPAVWDAFADGRISERHAVESSRLAASLPDEDVSPAASETDAESPVSDEAQPAADEATDASAPCESWRAFDEGARDRALRLSPARFAVSARALRERVHRESLETRHRRAARERGVWLTAELDGMATLTALLPADRAHDALARVDRAARHLRAVPDEERTLAELRADAFADLLTRPSGALAIPPVAAGRAGAEANVGAGAPGRAGAPAGAGAQTRAGAPTGAGAVAQAASRAGTDADAARDAAPESDAGPIAGRSATAARSTATVVVTIPALTLLGDGTEPAVLDGYGPIDLDTARRLAGEATSWVRVLTHPITGTPVALDRSTYRVPTALRRWLGVLSPTCVFPGCGRPARDCDLDHLTAWGEGGSTDDDNLAPECRHHHRVRHETRWHPSRDPDTGDMTWTSPLGAEIAEDPPPF